MGGEGVKFVAIKGRKRKREGKLFLAPSPSCLVFRHLCSRLDETGVQREEKTGGAAGGGGHSDGRSRRERSRLIAGSSGSAAPSRLSVVGKRERQRENEREWWLKAEGWR